MVQTSKQAQRTLAFVMLLSQPREQHGKSHHHGHRMSITCFIFPKDQMRYLISLKPSHCKEPEDRDIQSMTCQPEVTQVVRTRVRMQGHSPLQLVYFPFPQASSRSVFKVMRQTKAAITIWQIRVPILWPALVRGSQE